MFGHGQIEGFTEKYGMEYQRPRYDETPDHWLVERHEREIAPLLHRRWLFAESTNFLLYDFFEASGSVDENVFAYSNRNGGERAFVIYNNRYGSAHGTVDFSAAYADKGAGQLRQRRLFEGLGLTGDHSTTVAYRDSLTGLEYLRRSSVLAERGLTLELHAYQCHVFLDWRELRSTAHHPWDRLCDQLNGAGVPNLDDALVNLELRPVHDALRAQLDAGLVRQFADLAEHPRTVATGKDKKVERDRGEFFEQAWDRCEVFLRVAQAAYLSRTADGEKPAASRKPTSPSLLGPVFRERLRAAMRIPAVEALFPAPWPAAARRVLPSPSPQFTATAIWGPVMAWCVLELLAESIDAEKPESVALDLFDRLRLREPFAKAFLSLGFEADASWRVAARIKVVLLTGAGVGKVEGKQQDEQESATEIALPVEDVVADVYESTAAEAELAIPASDLASNSESAGANPAELDESLLPAALWLDPDVRWLTGVHTSQGCSYLVREPYEELLWWLSMPGLLRIAGENVVDSPRVHEISGRIGEALTAAEKAGYRVDRLQGLTDEETCDPEVETQSLEPEGLQSEETESQALLSNAEDVEIAKPLEADSREGAEAPIKRI